MGPRVLVAVCLSGCGPADFPHFVDARPADASPGGTSSQTLHASVYWLTETASGVPPRASSLLVYLLSVSGEIVNDATVEATIGGEVTGNVPRFADGAYAVNIDAWPPELRVDIHRASDFIEGVLISNIDVHEVSVVGRDALVAGSTIHVSWTPNGAPDLMAGVGVRSGQGAYTIHASELADTGEYESDQSAFPVAGGYTLEMDRHRALDINSIGSGGYVVLSVIDMIDLPSSLPPDGSPDAAIVDGGSDAAAAAARDAPP